MLIKKEGSFQFLKTQNWFASLDFLLPMSVGLEWNMQMERKWVEFGKLHGKSIWNRKINNVILTLCIWSCRNETNRAWKGKNFLFFACFCWTKRKQWIITFLLDAAPNWSIKIWRVKTYSQNELNPNIPKKNQITDIKNHYKPNSLL